jgi:hypothetical protein
MISLPAVDSNQWQDFERHARAIQTVGILMGKSASPSRRRVHNCARGMHRHCHRAMLKNTTDLNQKTNYATYG